MKKIILMFCLACLLDSAGRGQQIIGPFPQMDGGFETQFSIPLTNTTIPSGVPRIDWTVQNNSGTSLVLASGGRSGPKYLSFSATATRKLQSPTATNMAIQNGTPYTIQFYYRSTANASNGQVGVSTDGTGYPGTYISVSLPGTGGNWTKVTQTATGATSNASPRYGIGIIRFSAASGATIGIDDFVMYAGPADITPPGPPDILAFSNITASSIDISWGAAMGGTDGGGYILVRYPNEPASSDDPNPNGIYSAGSIIQQTQMGTVRYIGTGLAFTDSGLTEGTTYYYKVYTVDKAFNYSPESAGNCSTSNATAPSVQSSQLVFSEVLSNSMHVAWTSGNGSKRILVLNTQNSFSTPQDGTDPLPGPVYSGAGEQVMYNGSGNTVLLGGLSPGNEYWCRVFEYNGTGLNTAFNISAVPGNPSSQITGSIMTPPVIANPSSSGTTNAGSSLGASILSDGGSPLLERGTVWKTTPGVALTDNRLGEGGTSTGTFSHWRTLPAKSHIYFRAYASGAVGTSLTNEAELYTLADEPASQVTGFSASGTGNTDITLSWNGLSAGADGYLLLQKVGSALPSGIPADGTGYSSGANIGDGEVAMIINGGSITGITITGLVPATQYTFTVFPFAWNGSDPQTLNYLTSPSPPLATATTLVPEPVTYIWAGEDLADWTVAQNWNPPRTIPVINDILLFNDGTSKTITNIPSQTIGQLIVSGNTSVTLTALDPVTLSIRGNTGEDFVVDPGSRFSLYGDKALTVSLNSGASGIVSGDIFFNGSTMGTAHKLTASDNSGLKFAPGSKFTAGANLTGNPFGSSKANSVLFQNGSQFISYGGGNPFALNQPASVVIFQHGSRYKHMTTAIPSVSGRTYADFELDNSCNGSLINVSGIALLTIDSLILTSGDIHFNMSGGMVINGNIVTGPGTELGIDPTAPSSLTLSGSTAQSISGNGLITLGSHADVVVSNDVLAKKDVVIGGKLSISAGHALTVSAGKTLAVLGNTTISQPEGLVLQSDAGGTASFIDNGMITGTAVAERFLTGYSDPSDLRYHFLSSPVAAQPIRPEFVSLPNSTDDFYKWDEEHSTWINSKDDSGSWLPAFENNFNAGRGYLVAYPGEQKKRFKGSLNTFPASAPLDLVCSWTAFPPGNEGWNLLGNPFPSPIDWTLVKKGDGIDNALYYYDPVIQDYRYFIQFLPGYAIGNGSRYIPAMQGFMVHANSSGGSKVITLDNTMRTPGPADNYYKQVPLKNMLRLTLEGEGASDETFICFNEQATDGFDGTFDALKLKFGNKKVPRIYTLTPDRTGLAINTLPDSSPSVVIPVMINLPTEAAWHILAHETESFPAGTKILLEDPVKGAIQDITICPDFPVTGVKSEQPVCYLLRFSGPGFHGGNEKDNPCRIYAEGKILYIHSYAPEELSQVVVYNLLGQVLVRADLKKQALNWLEVPAASGLCVVRLITSGGSTTEKVVME